MSRLPLVRHIHFKRVQPFTSISKLQAHIVHQNLLHKARPQTYPAPLPLILTFTSSPVYTFGRRDDPSTLDAAFITSLREPLPRGKHAASHERAGAEVVKTSRGGLTTFHGPGQLVVYPIFDLKGASVRAHLKEGLDVRSYVRLLEETTIDALAEPCLDIPCVRTEHPGVWTSLPGQESAKIAALGVHLRRNITSYGLGLNVNTDLRWFERIVPCGLGGKRMTSVGEIWRRKKFMEGRGRARGRVTHGHKSFLTRRWVEGFAKGAFGWEEKGEGALASYSVCGVEELRRGRFGWLGLGDVDLSADVAEKETSETTREPPRATEREKEEWSTPGGYPQSPDEIRSLIKAAKNFPGDRNGFESPDDGSAH
ncbi:hypothetical protein BJ875DRAFT_472819 [Amylocarpus encephaloides]|uniref:lipoyl(octanoyl) transferase n=1 Tax=Amylocarpus encephaloides TaxID=45428 RepID=A0A9P8C1R9_9HELO|nr:hypothetical protein BJ875DRAFT_472819 [Amylocarpus encephaloides]